MYGSVIDQMKEALCDWQRWYQEGIFRKDFANLNNDAVSKDISDGKAGAMTFRSAWGWVYGLDEVKSQGVEAVFGRARFRQSQEKRQFIREISKIMAILL